MGGRVATAAHPLCVCGRWKRSYSTRDWVYRDVDPKTGMPGSMVWGWVEKIENYRAEDCPMHSGGRVA
jgi:hypothetical protein